MTLARLPAVFLLALPACAPQAFRADVGAALVEVRGGVALQNSSGGLELGQVKNDLQGDLDVGDAKGSPYVRLEADWGRHRAQLYGFGYSSSGTGVLAADFGNIPAGATVSTELDYLNISGAWSYDVLRDERFRLAPGVKLGYYMLDVTARLAAPPGFEQVDTTTLAPQLFVEGEVVLGIVTLQADFAVMNADLGDARGRFLDTGAMAKVAVGEKVELLAGYRHTVLDVFGRADGRDFDADLDISGWFIGGGIRF